MAKSNEYLPFPKCFATAAIHHAQEPEQWDSMAIVPPIVTSTTFKRYGPSDFKNYEYIRYGSPTQDVLGKVLAKLDNGNFGITFSSGMAAITTVLGLLKSGDHMIYGSDVFSTTKDLFATAQSKFGIGQSVVDFRDISNFEKSIQKITKLVFVETPTNPTMQVVDLKTVSEIAKKNGILFVVDNTFLTAYLQRPLDFGVDIVCYSLSKFVNGHSDVAMGALVTSNSDLFERLRLSQKLMGNIPSPFDCYQVNRAVKTLALRMQQHSKNALIVAQYLENHPKVERVLHPGLESHPQHELFKSQTSGSSGTFSFYLKGNYETSAIFLKSLKVFILAQSLGGCESLIGLPIKMSHSTLSPEEKADLGITDTLIRVTVGLEDVEDLVADLEQALNTI